jgi:hypothetical protein
MSRVGNIEPIQVRPSSNIYTAVTAVATLAVVIALTVLFVRAGALFETGLFGG